VTVRELANELLDLQVWQGVVFLVVFAFVSGFAARMADETYGALRRRRKHRKLEHNSEGGKEEA